MEQKTKPDTERKHEVLFRVSTIGELRALMKRRMNPEDKNFGNPILLHSIVSVWAANIAHNAKLPAAERKPIDMHVYVRGVWVGSKYVMTMIRKRQGRTELLATLKTDMKWYRTHLKEADI